MHALVPDVAKPSTGFACCALLSDLGFRFDAYHFDGFKGCRTTHDGGLEMEFLRRFLPGVTIP